MTDLKQNPQPKIPSGIELADALIAAMPIDPAPSTGHLDLDSKLTPRQACEKGLFALLRHHHIEALKLIQQLTKDNYLPAEIFLGIMYLAGRGIAKDIEQANLCFKKAIANIAWFNPETQTDPFLLYCLGQLCFTSEYRYIKDKSAADFFKKAAELEYAPALTGLAHCYRQGKEIEKDAKREMELLQVAATQNDVYALYDIGITYLKGLGVPLDAKKAIAFFQQGIEQGSARAQWRLGMCYLHGEGITKDAKKAITYFQSSAEKGFETAQFQLGQCYFLGEGASRDPQIAVTHFQGLAEKNYPMGQNAMGVCYYKGEGVHKEYTKAIMLFKQATESGFANARTNLGVCYLYGHGVPKDEKEALKQFTLAASKDSDAQVYLGFCYAKGLGVAKDKDAAAYWFELAAAQGHQVAVDNFETLTETDYVKLSERREAVNKQLKKKSIFGNTDDSLYDLVTSYIAPEEIAELDKNEKEAKSISRYFSSSAELYRLAAHRGDANAQYEMGICYLKGSGAEKSQSEAVKYLHQAAEQGYVKAKKALEKLPKEAAAWYKTKAELGYSREQFLLAKCYETGLGIPQNTEKALFWYERAARQEEPGAQEGFKKPLLANISSCVTAASASFWRKWTWKRDAELPEISTSDDIELSSLVVLPPRGAPSSL